jgi:hypothetical protein
VAKVFSKAGDGVKQVDFLSGIVGLDAEAVRVFGDIYCRGFEMKFPCDPTDDPLPHAETGVVNQP